jgi:transglutaminase-like putative cysteine protease
MAKPRGTNGSLLPSLPWTLAAVAFSLLPHVQFLPFWITGAFFVCGAWRYWIEKNRRPLPSTWFRVSLALVCFLGVLVTYESISGIGPGSALLAIMAALKLLETRQRRDQFVLLFIAIFLVMSSLLREQYLWSLPYMLLAILLTMSAWLRMSAVTQVPVLKSFAAGGRLILYAAPLAVAMWIFFPRIATPFWAVPIDTSASTSGLSDSMSPGDISSLSLSNKVAFRVTFDGAVPEPRDRYWRGLVLTNFNGRTWSGNAPMFVRNASDNIAGNGEPVFYQITLEPTRQHWVFALDRPVNWSLRQTFMGAQQQLSRVHPIDQRITYTAESYVDYRTEVDLNRTYRARYERIPEGSNDRTTELAVTMREAAGSDQAFIEDVLTKFHEEDYFYTLEPPPLGSNPVDRFLFDTRQGFCEHYASAFAVMMRAAGIPARVVLGYQGGELNPMGGHLIVRQADAHAWNEVWLEGVGWRRVDPTSAVAPERIDQGRSESMFDGAGAAWGLSAPSKLLYQLTLTWDALNTKWNDWVLGYGPENQNKFMQWLGMDDPDWQKMMLTLLGVVIALILLISFLLMLRYRPPAKDRALILYERFVRKSQLVPNTGESPSNFATRAAGDSSLSQASVESVTTSYLDARYGPHSRAKMQRLETEVREL